MKKACNIDDFKEDFKKIKMPDIKALQKADYGNAINTFLLWIKRQDKDDEQYMIKQKILPVLIGIIILTFLFMLYPIRNPILLAGCIIVYIGLMAILGLFFMDYRNISKETFDLSLYEYLRNKRERLESWESTPKLYNAIFLFFVVGVSMMIVGNTGLIDTLNTTQNIIIYLIINIIILIFFWWIGERRIRKRYKKKQLPLINSISDLLCELELDNKT